MQHAYASRLITCRCLEHEPFRGREVEALSAGLAVVHRRWHQRQIELDPLRLLLLSARATTSAWLPLPLPITMRMRDLQEPARIRIATDRPGSQQQIDTRSSFDHMGLFGYSLSKGSKVP